MDTKTENQSSAATVAATLIEDEYGRLNTEGKNLHEAGKYQEAVEMFTKAIEINGSNPEIYCNRGRSHVNIENPHLTVDDCQKALDIDPGYMEAHNLMGIAKVDLKQYKDAVKEFTKAIELDGSNPKFYC